MTALNPRYRFDRFVVGGANRLAVTAARAVAETPGAAYNPLYIYGASGLGKTHLLMALGQHAAEVNPGLTVDYVTLDEFNESYHAAIAAGQGEAYRRRYTDVGVLLVDDVQFLTHRREVQAELLRLTSTLITSGRQVVFASDRPPNEIDALDDRLIQQFAGGLVVDLPVADFETRVAILRRQAEDRRVTFDPSVIETIANLPISSIRGLIGACDRLVAVQAAQGTPLTSAEAREILTRTLPVPPVVGGAVSLAGGGEVVLPAETLMSLAPVEPEGSGGDEFGSFLSEISSAVARQVEAWRGRVAEAVLRWQGEGYRTARLEQLLEEDQAPEDPDGVVRGFEEDIEQLRLLEGEARGLDPALGGSAIFHDPDRVADARTQVAKAREGLTPPPGPAPVWRLEDFVESPVNRVALSSVQLVLADPGQHYNPLVLVGPTGTGKTHLLHAIGNALGSRPGALVACLRAQDLVEDLIQAIGNDRAAWWRARYRRVTALLLDDVQQLGGRDRTQEELFWLYNQLAESGRQMVFTSTVPPAHLETVDPRLRTRLEGGLVVELGAPDRPVREAIVGRLLRERAGEAEPELAGYLAARPVETVRGLQGLVQRVLAAAEAEHAKPSVGLARQVLEGSPAGPAKRPGAPRGSGLVSPTGSLRSREKMVWDWPGIADRLIEELR